MRERFCTFVTRWILAKWFIVQEYDLSYKKRFFSAVLEFGNFKRKNDHLECPYQGVYSSFSTCDCHVSLTGVIHVRHSLIRPESDQVKYEDQILHLDRREYDVLFSQPIVI
jgi:hypothetical protein